MCWPAFTTWTLDLLLEEGAGKTGEYLGEKKWLNIQLF